MTFVQDDGSVTSSAIRSVYDLPEDCAVAQDAQPTPSGLRFLNGVLQQAWTYKTYYQSGAEQLHTEWRDVPNVTSDKELK